MNKDELAGACLLCRWILGKLRHQRQLNGRPKEPFYAVNPRGNNDGRFVRLTYHGNIHRQILLRAHRVRKGRRLEFICQCFESISSRLVVHRKEIFVVGWHILEPHLFQLAIKCHGRAKRATTKKRKWKD